MMIEVSWSYHKQVQEMAISPEHSNEFYSTSQIVLQNTVCGPDMSKIWSWLSLDLVVFL